MELTFTKMEGLGNDFVLIDDRSLEIESLISYHDLAIRLCDRKFGIGGDGIIVISNSSLCDMKFKIFNSDGSEAEMCGNGMRCFAKYAFEKGIIDKQEFEVETLAGIIIPKINLNTKGRIDTIRVDMGEPVLETEKVPFISDHVQAVSEEVETPSGTFAVTAVSMGNPHAVIFVDDILTVPVTSVGPVLEVNKRFPDKTNIEFVEVVSPNELKMKVWERGAGVTLACGTGACAAVVAAIMNNKTERAVTVHLDGGILMIEWNRENNHIYKTGPARKVFEGRIAI